MRLGQSEVTKSLSSSNGSLPALYAYPVQQSPLSPPGTQQNVSQLSTTSQATSVPPPVAILQTPLSGNSLLGLSLPVCNYRVVQKNGTKFMAP